MLESALLWPSTAEQIQKLQCLGQAELHTRFLFVSGPSNKGQAELRFAPPTAVRTIFTVERPAPTPDQIVTLNHQAIAALGISRCGEIEVT